MATEEETKAAEKKELVAKFASFNKNVFKTLKKVDPAQKRKDILKKKTNQAWKYNEDFIEAGR